MDLERSLRGECLPGRECRWVTLQINFTGGTVAKTFARDKLADVLPNASLGVALQGIGEGARIRPQFVSVSQGVVGVQIFNTYGATKEPGEPDHCGVVGGASYWFAISPGGHC
jgi:hypothetical protein